MGADAKRSYAVVGVGAIGGAYGARLAAAEHPVHFVARSDAAHIADHGLRVDSVLGDIVLGPDEVSVFANPADVPPVDTVLICLKTTDNAALGSILPALVREGTTVAMLQNGLGAEDDAAAALAAAGLDDVTVLGALCFVCSEKVGPGHIHHIDFGRVTVGEWRPGYEAAGVTAAVQALSDDLAAAGFPVSPQESLGVARWKKLVWNVPYNGLSVVLDTGTKELMADPASRALCGELMHEVVDGADACGHGFDRSFIDAMMSDTIDMIPYAPSMKVDYDTGRPLEIDAIYRRPIAAAATAGVALPRMSALADQLTFLDTRNRA